MALYKYFEKASVLPNPDGPLSARVPSSAIAEANKRVQPLLAEAGSTSKKTGKRGQYLVYTDEEKLKIGKELQKWAWAWPGAEMYLRKIDAQKRFYLSFAKFTSLEKYALYGIISMIIPWILYDFTRLFG